VISDGKLDPAALDDPLLGSDPHQHLAHDPWPDDELNNKIKDPGHDRTIVTAKLGQIKRLSIASIFMYVSLAVLVIAVLMVGTGWIGTQMEEAAMLFAVALFFVAIVYMMCSVGRPTS
jgi:hypothetical protein